MGIAGRYVAVVALALGVSRVAFAQDNSAAVESLFDEGKKLAGAGKYAEACPKFLASYNLEHRVGTLLNLADCYEKNGQLASAWARFVDVNTLATRAGQTERAEYAEQHASALKPKLSMLTISARSPPADLRVKRDGIALDAAAIGVPVAVDSGDHVIEASAPGKQPWTSTVKVAGDGTVASIEIPELPATAAVAAPPVESDHPTGLSGRKIAALAVGGAGVLSVGIGSVFGGLALGKKSDSAASCDVGGVANRCYPSGATARRDAASDATVSTVFFVAGGALAAGAVVLWLSPTSSSSEKAVAISFDPRGVRMTGSF